MKDRQTLTLTKRGLTPEETKDLVTFKLNGFLPSISKDLHGRIKESTDSVIKALSYSVQKNGYMDKHRFSPDVWQALGIIPAPITEAGEYPGPQKVDDETELFRGLINSDNVSYTDYLKKTKKDSQAELFRQLQQDGKLSNDVSIGDNGYLVRADGRSFSNVDICNTLDDAAEKFATELAIEFLAFSRASLDEMRRKELNKMICSCLETTISRIALTILHPDDVFTAAGHKKWKEHLEMVASFATLAIAVDSIFGTSSIPDDIVS